LYISLPELKEKAIQALEIDAQQNQELLKQALTDLYGQEKVKLLSHNEQHYLSLPQFYFSEKGIAQKIVRLQEKKTSLPSLNFDKIYQEIRLPDALGLSLLRISTEEFSGPAK
jgi:hypothetical protein